MMARFGAMVAPMVLLLGEDFPWLPGFIYGGAPILSGIFAFFLPETLAQPLDDHCHTEENFRVNMMKTTKGYEGVSLNLNDKWCGVSTYFSDCN
uniref:Uncharacterized protein n=1 Tax=Sinocyclocheilus rhinocerous TaxID=307959 RepID=A0A673FR89_9TELE